jgi:hypothetical protein
MKRPILLLFLGVALLLAATTFLFWRRAADSEASAARQAPAPSAGDSQLVPDPAPAPANATAPAMPSKTTSATAIASAFAALRDRAADPMALLAALRQQLLAADPRQAIAAIEEFLAAGNDAATGGEFAIGPGGTQLASSPSFRVMLLDVLGELSRKARSDAGARIGRAILTQKTSADEWAISMRNVAWHEPQAAPFLASKMREMLAWQPWREQPTGGMIEAFDVIVFTRDASFIPTLVDLQSDGTHEFQQAAAVALDRLAEAAPLSVLTYLNANPMLLAEAPLVRADYYAKADLAQPAQREALELHLGRPDISLEEKTKILKALATPASFVSDNLLTASAPPNDDTTRQATLSKTIGTWLAANRFPELGTELRQLQQRLGAR